jgi:hypothetical protein
MLELSVFATESSSETQLAAVEILTLFVVAAVNIMYAGVCTAVDRAV